MGNRGLWSGIASKDRRPAFPWGVRFPGPDPAKSIDTIVRGIGEQSLGIDGLLTVGETVGVLAQQGASSSGVGTGGAMLDFGTLTDPYGGYNATDDEWTVPAHGAGLYVVVANVGFNSASGSIFLRIALNVNDIDTQLSTLLIGTQGTNQTMPPLYWLRTFVAGDRFGVRAFTISGTVNVSLSNFGAVRLHAESVGA